jgi:hypothetical protein
MIRAGLVVMVVVSVALLMMVMTADWLNAWPFPIGRSRDTLSDVRDENGLILTFGDRCVIITSADPYQPLEVVVRSSQTADDWEEGF